ANILTAFKIWFNEDKRKRKAQSALPSIPARIQGSYIATQIPHTLGPPADQNASGSLILGEATLKRAFDELSWFSKSRSTRSIPRTLSPTWHHLVPFSSSITSELGEDIECLNGRPLATLRVEEARCHRIKFMLPPELLSETLEINTDMEETHVELKTRMSYGHNQRGI
ncbi:hypothetical protein FRB94_001409, partial [Tulasnella sp. JGI-2019a]